MTRIYSSDNPGKRRSQHMRASAELLRHVSQKQQIDEDVCDMLAAMVYELRGVEKCLDEAVEAWEKRDYWIKAEQFRQKFAWVGLTHDTLVGIIKAEDWAQLPLFIVKTLPHFAEIKINKITRRPDLWQGKYAKLRDELA